MSVFTGVARFMAGAVLILGGALSMTACGGGGAAAGTPVLGGGNAGAVTSDLALTIDKTAVPNTGTEQVTVTVTTLDALRNVVGGAPVSVSVDKNAFVAPSGTTTDKTSGQLTATVSIGSDHTNRTVTVTATSGTIQRTISFDVVDSTVSVTQANDLSMLLDKLSIGDSGSDVINVTVTAVDAARNVIGGIPVTFSVNNNATIFVPSSTTDTQGVATAVVKIGSDKSNRLITVTAKSGTLTRAATFNVIGAKLQATALPSQPAAGSQAVVDYKLTDVNQNPMANMPITVSAPGLPNASGVTDVNGAYKYVYTASTTPGPIDISALAGGAVSVLTVTVPTGTSTVPAPTGVVSTASLTASPNVVSVNTASTANQSEIRALFQTASNAPLKNVRVRFDLNGDVNSIGGALSAGNSLVYTDAAGVAVTNYSPAGRSSPTNGVQVRACWDYNDFTTGCPNQVLVNLTVVSQALSISVGSDNKLDASVPLVFIKRYVVLVVDAAGNAKPDVQITPSIDLVSYAKGAYYSAPSAWVQTVNIICPNEDINRNSLIDGGEDTNHNGQLDPRKSDVTISMDGSTKTDANGMAILKIVYPRTHAGWVSFKITAGASGVLSPPAYYPVVGTQSWLPVLAEDMKAESPPPGRYSPYGEVADCSVPN